MWDHVGVMRTETGLQRGLTALEDIRHALTGIGVDGGQRAFNLTWHDWLNLQSLLDISETIAEAALWRENSRGAHHREDFPDEGDLETSYFTIARQKDGELDVGRAPVEFTIVKPGESLLKNEADAAE